MTDAYLDDSPLAVIPTADPLGIRVCNTEVTRSGHIVLTSRYTVPWHDKYATTTNIATFMQSWYQSPSQKRYAVVHVSSTGFVHRVVNLTYGNIDMRQVKPAEILQLWVGTRSKSAILVHNHASGDLTPDEEDLEFTQTIADLASLCGMRLLDHLIIGNWPEQGFLSMREKGFFV